ncbi:bifunctional NAD(P)H-hydrate repair enzyme [Rhodococcoides trifolii]|uniref:Bifunctional NAD(P)H-hydrate repair enzyme n=1 Tax=Rhodococcoides trifolii TaxID=908250 RepID=A0A917LDE2_9NOCA|nr:NAD(P)H-hydrate dehydratase [Rhodococcus trifolii]GGG13965.1 bifunctional NAD(P)H-hydrate repair enzyme [Rhodococcus trifolii]
MQHYYTADEVRSAEAPLIDALPEGVPMRRAAHGLAAAVVSELRSVAGGVNGRRVGIIVGSGDNGGDALWAGAALRRRGVAVEAFLLTPDRVHSDGLAAYRRAGGRVVTELTKPDLVLDAIVGLSGRGSLRPDAARVVSEITAPIVAVDLPSGVDPDTGAVDGPAVNAAVTVTFGALKPVHVLAGDRCGRTVLVPIGLDLAPSAITAFTDDEVGALWPVPGPQDDKYTQGVVGVVAGSDTFPGAAVLCVGAATTATSGMVRYVGTGRDEVLRHWPEVVATTELADAGRVQAWVIGPGAGTDGEALDTLRSLLATDLPVLVDADGLTLVAEHPELVRDRSAPTVLTPHAGEFERLTGRSPAPDRIAATRTLAADWGVTVLLKGRATVIADPDGQVVVNDAGSSWASTAGSGDVLSGMLGALLAAGLKPNVAAAAAARAHAVAAGLAASGAPVSASPLLQAVRPAIRSLRHNR